MIISNFGYQKVLFDCSFLRDLFTKIQLYYIKGVCVFFPLNLFFDYAVQPTDLNISAPIISLYRYILSKYNNMPYK